MSEYRQKREWGARYSNVTQDVSGKNIRNNGKKGENKWNERKKGENKWNEGEKKG